MWRRSTTAALAALAMASACAQTPVPLSTIVETRAGAVRGSIEAGVRSFKGIPYAAPPTGEMRWRPPVPVEPWSDIRDATAFGPQCVQPQQAATRQPMSEDCLTLNVWTPATSANERLPILVWVHGGNFTVGSGARHDGTNLARRGIVVVSLNYRLGAIGFLAHPWLSRESERGRSGNYGLMDQMAALRWVRENIAAFGGNPAEVTLAGQSAGATSVADLMVSPAATGLFQRAIVHSAGGSFGSQEPFAAAEREGATLGPDIAALRAIPAEELIARFPQKSAMSPDHHFYPSMDGHTVPDEPLALLRAGKARMPMLIGYNRDEALFWSRDLPRTVDDYRAYVAAWFPPGRAGDVLDRYPAASDTEVPGAVARFVTDFKIAAPTAQIARGVSAVAPVHAYLFSRVSPANRTGFGGAAHTTELAYVFDVLPSDPAQYDDRDRIVSQQMADAWARFVKTGSPNGDGSPQWPAHRDPDYRVMEFGDATTSAPIADNPGIAFFDSSPAETPRAR